MKEEFFLENKKMSEAEKERASDSCLEGLIEHINEYRDFYESKFVADSKNEGLGLPREEKEEMLAEIKKLQENILNDYESEKNLKIKRESQLNHIMDNSIIINANGQAIRYEKGKDVKEESRKKIREEISLLNYYIKELNQSPELIEEELNHEDGHLQKFTAFFNGKIDPRSPNKIILFKFFRDLEKGEVKKEDFSARLAEIDEKTRIKNFLDLHKLEQEGLIIEKEDGEEYYKYILNT